MVRSVSQDRRGDAFRERGARPAPIIAQVAANGALCGLDNPHIACFPGVLVAHGKTSKTIVLFAGSVDTTRNVVPRGSNTSASPNSFPSLVISSVGITRTPGGT